MKKFLLSLAAVVGMGFTAGAATATFDLTGSGAAGTITDGPLTVTFAKNDAGTAPTRYSDGVRIYYNSNGNGGSMTISCASGSVITAVDFTMTSGYSWPDGACGNVGTLSGNNWTSDGVSSVTFQNTNTTNKQVRVAGMTVTYTDGEGGGSGTVTPTPDPVEPDVPAGEEVTETWTAAASGITAGTSTTAPSTPTPETSTATGIQYTFYQTVVNSGGYLFIKGGSSAGYVSWKLDYNISSIKMKTSSGNSTATDNKVTVYANDVVIADNMVVGATSTEYTVNIPAEYQAAGTVYKVLGSGSKNAQFVSFTYVKAAADDDDTPSIYILGRGDGLDWEPFPGYRVKQQSNGVYQFAISNLSVFRFSTVKATDWPNFDSGSYGVAESLGDAVYKTGQVVDLQEGSVDNIVLPWAGDYTITINLNEGTLTALTNTEKTMPTVYLRGDMNGWDPQEAWQMEYIGDNIYTFNCTTPIAVGTTFKFGDSSFAVVNYGGSEVTLGDEEVTVDLVYNGGNLSFNKAFTGKITLNITGEQTAKATFVYEAAEQPTPGESGEVTFDFINETYGMTRLDSTSSAYNPNPVEAVQEPVTVTLAGSNSNATRLWSDGVRFYKGSYYTVSCENGVITEIVATYKNASAAGNFSLAEGGAGEYTTPNSSAVGTWTGSAASVTINCAVQSGNVALSTLKVTYQVEGGSKQSAALKFSESEVTVAVGESFTAPEFTKATTAAVTFTSSNEKVATVTEEGVVTVNDVIGSATIKATSEANEEFYAGEASFVITVTPAADAVLTVAEAIEAIENGYTGEATVEGYVSSITEISCTDVEYDGKAGYGNATYVIVDNEDQDPGLTIYRGYWFNNERFTSTIAKELYVNSKVKVVGSLLMYGTTPEMGTGNHIIECNGVTGIADVEINAAPVEYFNLQGVRVANPENGLYIRRQGNNVSKVLVK